MFTLCWAAKGGSGTTVVAAAIALATGPTRNRRRCLLVDLAGDLPTALGIPDPAGPGVADWLASDAPASRLGALELAIADRLTLLPAGQVPVTDAQRHAHAPRWVELAGWLAEPERRVIVDCGRQPPRALAALAGTNLLVTRACYLAVRAAARASTCPTGIVLIEEPGRTLTPDAIERAVGAPIVARLLVDPAVARAVDSGLLAARLPASFRRIVGAAA